MRLAITIAKRVGAAAFEVLAGPEVPLPDQFEAFKQMQADPAAASAFERVEVWTSSQGRAKMWRVREAGAGINPAAVAPPTEPADSAPVDEAPAGEPASEATSEPAGDPASESPESSDAPAPAGMESALPTSKKPKSK
jgi:hypothetical protein